MTGLFDFVWDALAVLMANPVVVLAFQLGAVYLGILWLASSYWVYRDLGRRTRNVVTPFLAGASVIMFTPFLFPLALVAYRIARPQDTVGERRVGDLQQLLLEVETDRDLCPACDAPVESDWVRCPLCRVDLAVRCKDCENPIGLDWTVCAWCAADVPWATELDEPDVVFQPVPAHPVPITPVPAEPVPAPAPAPAPRHAPGGSAMPAGWPLPGEGLAARFTSPPSLRGVQEQLELAFQRMRERLAAGGRDGDLASETSALSSDDDDTADHDGVRQDRRPFAGLMGSLPMIATEPLPELAPSQSTDGARNGNGRHRDEEMHQTRDDAREETRRDLPRPPMDRVLAVDPPDARLATAGATRADVAGEEVDVTARHDDASRDGNGRTAHSSASWNGFAPRPAPGGGMPSSRGGSRDRSRSRGRHDSAGHEAQPTSNRG
jgi:hypothetical protein